MGQIFSSFNPLRCQARSKQLPTNPLLWNEKQTKQAAEIMFNAYDKDHNGTINKDELNELFDACGSHLADFGTDNLDFSELLGNLIKKYDRDGNTELSYDEFVPLFNDMVGRMAEEGFVEKRSLPQFQRAIKAAVQETHVLIVSLDYKYDKKLELTSIVDGQNMERMARNSGIRDVVTLYDHHDFKNPWFPLKKNIKREIHAIGKRCHKDDVFVFFFSGHGLNVPDEDGDEEDGEDEAFAVPNKKGELTHDGILIDDDFAKYLDNYIPKGTRILVITDCCHSGSICDIDTFNYKHEIVAVSSAKDNQTSLDMATFGRNGGVLTCAIGDVLKERPVLRDTTAASVADIYNGCIGKVAQVAKRARHQQDIGIQHANIQPHQFPWPFVSSF